MAEELEATLATVRQETAFLAKYFDLRKRCEQMQQANEKMVNRLQHVKKIIKRHKREKKFLEARLIEHGDNYKESQVPVSWEEDQLFNCLRPNDSSGTKEEDTVESVSKPSSDKLTALSSIKPYLQAYGKKDSASKSRKIKSEKEKDPNAPKKPVNVFQLFCQEQKQMVQALYLQENKDEIAHHELTRRLAQKWHLMSQEEKQPYYDLHEQENEKYVQELKAYESKSENINQSMDITQSSSEAYMAALNIPSQLDIKEEIE